MSVVAVDPGYEVSAWVLFNGAGVVGHAIEPNSMLLNRFRQYSFADVSGIVFEGVEGFGMPVGKEVMETVFVTGRMFEAAVERYSESRVHRLYRKEVKRHLCGSTQAKDPNLRVALMDRFGGKDAAIGKAKSPGPLFGIKSHEWSALAIAVTWWDQAQAKTSEAIVDSTPTLGGAVHSLPLTSGAMTDPRFRF